MPKQAELLVAYFVFGDDQLKREAVLNRLKVRLEEYGDLSFNFDIFNGEVDSGEAIVSACTTIPFASEKRLVLVNSADKLKQKDAAVVCDYLTNSLDSTVLCLVAEKGNKTSKLYKAVAAIDKKALVDCAKPTRKELPGKVIAMAKLHGLAIDNSAAHALISLLGDDTVHIDSELEKLSLAYSGSAALTERDINALVASVVEPKPWDFVDAFSARDLGLCLDLFDRIKSTSAYSLMGACTTRIRELICAQCAQDSGLNVAATLANEFSTQEWKMKNHTRYAREFTREELREALAGSMEYEQKMKSGADPDAALIDWLISVLKR